MNFRVSSLKLGYKTSPLTLFLHINKPLHVLQFLSSSHVSINLVLFFSVISLGSLFLLTKLQKSSSFNDFCNSFSSSFSIFSLNVMLICSII